MILRITYVILFPLTPIFCIIGAYSVYGNYADIIVLTVFGGIGYLTRKLKFVVASLILGFILGPMIEERLRQSLLISKGNFSIFILHPISLGFLLFALALILSFPVKARLKRRYTGT
jgi:TctA family transporter